MKAHRSTISSDERKPAGMFCASVAYPVTEGGTFDFEYFVDQYVPMFVASLGDNCTGFEIRQGLQAPGAPAPWYICLANFWVKSGEEFGAALARHGDRIYGEIPRFTNIEPVRGWDAVIRSSADGETSAPQR